MNSMSSQERADRRRTLSARWAKRSLLVGFLLIPATTLFPYQFFPDETAFRRSTPFLHWFSQDFGNFQDIGGNILLYVPFGFGLALLATQKRCRNVTMLVSALVAAVSVSFITELLQAFLPTRDPSWADIAANSIGSLIGCLIFQFTTAPILSALLRLESKLRAYVSPRRVTAAFLCYTLFGILLSVSLQRAILLDNWDPSYPLLLGNDPTGKRPWQGRVFEMQLASRAISAQRVGEIAANKQPLSAQDGVLVSYCPSGRPQPRATALDSSSPSATRESAQSSAETWLSTTSQQELEVRIPAREISERLKKTNQFTLRVVCAPLLHGEAPFGRIVSLSQDSQHLNFILSQEAANLVFGFRTRLTGVAGEPALNVQNVFVTSDPKVLLLTYDGSSLRLYVNGQRDAHSLLMSPGAVAFHWLLRLRMHELRGYAVVYELMLLTPLGVLLGIAAGNMNYGRARDVALILAGAITSPSLVEFILAAVRVSPVDAGYLLLKVCFILGIVGIWRSDRESAD